MEQSPFKGKKALVMGLGLHGGGVETVRFLTGRGADVVCTDLRTEEQLRPSLDALEGLPVRYVLGRHNPGDFDAADIIVKNPAVASDNPLLAGRRNIETDISLFLRCSSSPLIALTGSKGKSTAASALHHILRCRYPGARLGGNITVSPLNFLEDLRSGDPVVLELSSWQLADLRRNRDFHPEIACITNLMQDHQNRYASFADYEADKTVVFTSLAPGGLGVFPDNRYGRKWAAGCAGTSVLVGTEPPGAPRSSPPPAPGSPKTTAGCIIPVPRCPRTAPKTFFPENSRFPGGPFASTPSSPEPSPACGDAMPE